MERKKSDSVSVAQFTSLFPEASNLSVEDHKGIYRGHVEGMQMACEEHEKVFFQQYQMGVKIKDFGDKQ